MWETDGISWDMMGWTHQMIHGSNKDDVMVVYIQGGAPPVMFVGL